MWTVVRIAFLLLVATALGDAQQTLWTINLKDSNLDPMGAEVLAVRVCAGLFNRQDTAVYLLENESDQGWIDDGVVDVTNAQEKTPLEFLTTCLDPAANNEIVRGYMSYDFSAQQLVLPNLITVAAVLDAVPLDVNTAFPTSDELKLLFDAVSEFQGFSALDATMYVYEQWGDQTTSMSKMDPGYETPNSQSNPQLTGTPELGLTDYIVKEKLFNFFLWYGCLPGAEGDFVNYMASNSPFWPNPIPVWGYDTSFLVFGGYLYEANTLCTDSKNMGSVPTRNVNNLSFFSRAPAITQPLMTTDSPPLTYDSTKTYIAFVVGDGDNIKFVKDGEASRKAWMNRRVEYCKSSTLPDCFPLSWSLSPHLLYVAPDIIQWYYDEALETGADAFVLPPSGHLYSYPGSMSGDVQAEFVRLSESDAQLMDTNGLVGWEVAGTWLNAFRSYFPRYSANNIIRSIFALNVPYSLPVVTAAFSDTYEVVNGNVVVFEPQSWRGTDDRDGTPVFFPPMKKAEQINSFPRGSISYLYLTSDNGFTIDDVIELVGYLDDHVIVADSRQLASLALEREASQGSNWYDGICNAIPFLPC